MKMYVQKIMLVCVAVFLVVGTASITFATVDCGSAKVIMVGAAPGSGGTGSSGIKIELRNDTGVRRGADWEPGTNRMFYLTTELADQGLATALTAFSLEQNVWVRIGGSAEPNSLISIIYLNAR